MSSSGEAKQIQKVVPSLRRGPHDWHLSVSHSPSVRVILAPVSSDRDGLEFDAISFELYENGPAVCFRRCIERNPSSTVKYKDRWVLIASQLIGTSIHAQIWYEDHAVS